MMAVTADKYELPLCIEDSSSKLAKKLGVSRYTIIRSASIGFNGKKSGRRIVKVNIKEEDTVV